jgi:hypothetical protein
MSLYGGRNWLFSDCCLSKQEGKLAFAESRVCTADKRGKEWQAAADNCSAEFGLARLKMWLARASCTGLHIHRQLG